MAVKIMCACCICDQVIVTSPGRDSIFYSKVNEKLVTLAVNLYVYVLQSDDVWATVLALSLLSLKYADKKAEWEMIELKATQWLSHQQLDGHTVDELLQCARNTLQATEWKLSFTSLQAFMHILDLTMLFVYRCCLIYKANKMASNGFVSRCNTGSKSTCCSLASSDKLSHFTELLAG